MKYFSLFILLLLTLQGFCENQQDAQKSRYNLLNPTPSDKMRGFETDRPDLTESAYTVDAGHFQFETDLFKSERTKIDGTTFIQNSYNAFNLKIGITNTLDIQIISDMLIRSKIKGDNSKTSSSFGNITIRAKQNLYGNDSGNSAIALLPFVNIPTISDAEITGGLVLPFSLSLPKGWGFGAQIETDFINNLSGNGYHINPLASATIAHQLFNNFSFFAEGLITREFEMKLVELFLDGGFVYEITPNIKLDTGIYYGIKDVSPKIYFIGFSFRI